MISYTETRVCVWLAGIGGALTSVGGVLLAAPHDAVSQSVVLGCVAGGAGLSMLSAIVLGKKANTISSE